MADPPAEHDTETEPVVRPDHHGSGVDHPTEEVRPKRTLLRKLIRVVLVLFVLAILLVALTPTLLSTDPGTRWFVSIINKSAPGELTVDNLQLSWFGGQRVEGIGYDDPAHGLQATVAEIDMSDIGLFDLMTGSRRLGSVLINDIDLLVTQLPSDRLFPKDTPAKRSELSKQRFKLPPSLAGTLSITDLQATYQPLESESIVLTIDQDEVTVADLRDITFEIDATVRQGTKQGRIALSGDVLNLFDPDGFEQTNQAAYDITLQIEDLPTQAIDQLASGFSTGVEPGLLTALLGEGELVSTGTVKGTIDQLVSDLSITAPKLRVELDQRTEENTLIASPESYAKLDLDQDAFAALFPKSGLKLAEPTQIELASIEMSLPIVQQAVDWDKATASLLLRAGDNLAVIDDRGEKLWINNLKITGNSTSIADQLSLKLTTMLSAVTTESDVTEEDVAIDLIIREPMRDTREIDFFSESLPIQLTDALMGQDGKLVLYLGELLSLQADLQGKLVTGDDGIEIIEQHFSLRPEGRVNGTVSGSFADGRFTLSTPVNEPVKAVLVPEAFASLMEMLSGREGEPALTINQDMPVYLTIRDAQRGPVSITTRRDKAGLEGFYPDPDQTSLAAEIELSPARVFDPKLKKTYELRGGSLMFSAPDLRGKTQIKAELDLWVRPDAGSEGVASLLTWQTTVTDLLDSAGSVPLDGKTLMQQLSATGGVQLKNAPSGLFDSLLNRDGDLASILGPFVQQMDAGFSYKDGRPTGATVRLNWDEQNNQPIDGAWASMKPAAFDIDDQQMLTVRGGEDLELEVRVSEEFGNRWMGKLHPILFDAKSGDRPVKVKVDGKSFRFPLKGEAMKGARVEATVDLGTIEFGNDALLGKVMEWTKRPGERAIFEPARVKLVDGNISYDQFDLAVGNVKLRLDGEVDLASGQIVDMAVRVPGDSLIRVFNELEGIIPPDDYLSIPMTGAIRQPEFDSKLLGREVARLITRGVIDKQKDDLKDLIRKGIGGDGDEPGPDGEPDPADEVADELIERGLDLLFRRLGKDKE
ncbi:MAG: hypothetical protein AAF085_03405 [Planctomycetota bacterium]